MPNRHMMPDSYCTDHLLEDIAHQKGLGDGVAEGEKNMCVKCGHTVDAHHDPFQSF